MSPIVHFFISLTVLIHWYLECFSCVEDEYWRYADDNLEESHGKIIYSSVVSIAIFMFIFYSSLVHLFY